MDTLESAHSRLTWTFPQHPLSTSVCGIYRYRARRPSPDAYGSPYFGLGRNSDARSGSESGYAQRSQCVESGQTANLDASDLNYTFPGRWAKNPILFFERKLTNRNTHGRHTENLYSFTNSALNSRSASVRPFPVNTSDFALLTGSSINPFSCSRVMACQSSDFQTWQPSCSVR